MEVLVYNKKAKFNYHILETLEAGIKLLGLEVKAIRAKNITIDEAWIKLSETAAHLVGCNITPLKLASWETYTPNRDRILLIKSRQLKKLKGEVQKGLTIIPLRVYLNAKQLIKVEIALVKGKKTYDKRETIKERDLKRYGH